jgi:CelD/BcsL family acetyltransferase involved in cellulose biosynthesis
VGKEEGGLVSLTPATAARPLLLSHHDDLRPYVDAWRALASASGTSYFATPDWVLSWWETLGREVTGEVAVWRSESGTVDAVVPLGRLSTALQRRLPVRVPIWTNLGSGPGAADHCGFAVSADRAPDVSRWLTERSHERTLLLSNLDPDSGRPYVPEGARPVETSRCPRLDLSATELGSAKFRKQLRYQEKRLAAEGVTFRYVPAGEVDEAILATTFDLHEVRRESMGETTSFDRSKLDFHRRLVSRGTTGRGPAAVLASRGDQVVGLLYGLRWGEVFAYFQGGWRPEWSAYSLGTVLVARAAAYAKEDGALVFDLLRGAEPYKYRLGAVDRCDETWLVPQGIGGQLVAARHRLRARKAAAATS